MLSEKGPDGEGSLSKLIVGSKKETELAGLSAAMKNRITEILESTCFTQYGFTVNYDGENNTMVTITLSGSPEYQFVIHPTGNGVFTSSECPGIHLDAAETFQRKDFELCINAIKEWVERIIDRQRDWILDEFGGVADSDPSSKQR